MIRNPRLRRPVVTLFVVTVAATQSCSATKDNVGTNPAPSITLSIHPTRAAVAPGDSVAIGATLYGRWGYTGAGAAFALTGAPDGVTFTISPLQTSGAVTTATITTSVAVSVPPGTYTINLTGSGTDVGVVSTSFELTVTEPSIAISINPTRATVAQGGSLAIEATLTGSGGFKGAGAAFAMTNAPAGVTFTVSPLQTSGAVTSATITASVAAAAPPGRYAINLTGSGTGVSVVSTSFELIVTAPSIAISINPAHATVARGGSMAIGATLTGSGGFKGAGAAFALTGAPAGITFAVSNLQTSDSVTIATITASVAATVPFGTYALNVIGSGTGVNAVSAPIAITVADICFSLSVNPAAVILLPEDVAIATITINRTNSFAGSVALSGSSSGGRFWMLFDPTSTTGNSSTMTAGTGGPSEKYTLTITGAATGCGSQTATIAVVVP